MTHSKPERYRRRTRAVPAALVLALAGSAAAIAPAGAATPGAGFPTVVGGPGRGPALTTSLNAQSLVATPDGASVVVADGRLHVVRLINLAAGTSSVLAGDGAAGTLGDGGPATAAQLVFPSGVAYGPDGTLYIADGGAHVVRAVSIAGIISTVAGTGIAAPSSPAAAGDGGPATSAQLNLPDALTFLPGQGLLIADARRGDLRLVSMSGATAGTISTAATGFSFPDGLVVGGSTVYVADSSGQTNTIDTVTGITTTSPGTTTLYAGTPGRTGATNGPRQTAVFNGPNGLAIDAGGRLLVADSFSGELRAIDPTTGLVTTVAGTGMTGFSGDGGAPAAAQFSYVSGVAILGDGSLVLGDSNRLRRITGLTTVMGVSAGGTVNTVAGNGSAAFSGDGLAPVDATLNTPQAVAVNQAGDVAIADSNNNAIRLVRAGTNVVTTLTTLSLPLSVVWDGSNVLAIAAGRLYSVAPDGTATVIAGGGSGGPGDGGPATAGAFSVPFDAAVAPDGTIYVADTAHNSVRAISTAGIITTVAGNGTPFTTGDGGAATGAGVPMPTAVAVLPDGRVLVALSINSSFYNAHVVRVFTPGGTISTFAGGPTAGYSGDGGPATSATFGGITRMAVASDRSVYLADAVDNAVRRVGPDGIVSTVAGDGTAGFLGSETGSAGSRVSTPYGVAVGPGGALYLADTGNDRIRAQAASVNPPSALPEAPLPVLLVLGGAGLTAVLATVRSRRRTARS